MRITVSPAIAPAAASVRSQGVLRVVQPLAAVPVGETYQVVAPAIRANARTARKARRASTVFITPRTSRRGQFPEVATLITEAALRESRARQVARRIRATKAGRR